MAEVARVVAGLFQRPQDEGRKRLLPPPRPLDVFGDRLADLRGKPCRQPGREPFLVGSWRRRHLQVGELREQMSDRLWIGTLVHAVERFPPTLREQAPDRLVGEDHQLLY